MKRNVKESIAQCMSDVHVTENGGLNARFYFPEDFIGFQGHFPDKKILPGVCQVQCVINMLEKWKEGRAVLKEVVVAKFLSPVSASEELVCLCNIISELDDEYILKAVFSKDEQKIAEVKLKVGFDQGIK